MAGEKFDLHVHSNLSDGSQSRESLIMQAVNEEMLAISFTDHNISGRKEMLSLTQNKNINIIPGIELDCDLPIKMHIIGYFIQSEDKVDNFLTLNKIENEARCRKIIEKLNIEYNLNIQEEELEKFKSDFITKRSIINLLLARNLGSEVREVTYKYLSKESKAYVPMIRLNAKEAINLIRTNGGIPVLAHPVTIYRDQTTKFFETLLKELIDYGLMGIEIKNLRENNQYQLYFQKMAKKYNLLMTAGSDFHKLDRDDWGILLNPDEYLYPLIDKGNEGIKR